MARTATHYGHCQICGSYQKLPGDVLSLHGYTVEWGFFSGVCNGSGHKPFEKSIDLIAEAIDRTTRAADRLQELIAELTKPAVTPMTWVNYTIKAKNRDEKDRSAWAQGEVIKGEYDLKTRTEFFVMVEDGKLKAPLSAYGADTVLEAATEGNRKYARVQAARMNQMREYVQWQQERIKDWKPSELKEVPESDRGSTKSIPKVHFEVTKYGYKTSICSSSAMGAQRNAMARLTGDREKVTCAACLKALKERDELPAKRAAEAEKERQRQLKSLEKDVKMYSKWIKDGDDDPMVVMRWTEMLNQATADLEKLKAEQ